MDTDTKDKVGANNGIHPKEQSKEYEQAKQPPVDKHNVVLIISYLTGIVILLPWNILITVSGYWDYKFRNTTIAGDEWKDAEPTKYQAEFMSYVSIAANVPGATFTILHALFGHKFNMKLRIIEGQLVLNTVFIGIVILAILDTDDWQKTFLIINLCLIVIICSANAIFQGSFNACLGTFPVNYIGACVNGAGMGGLLPSLVSVLIIAISANDQMSGVYSFVFAWIVAMLCLGWTMYLWRNDFWNYYSSLETTTTSAFTLKEDISAYMDIFRDAWVFIVATLINFTVTLVVFPAITVLIEPSNDNETQWNDLYLVPVGCFVLYNFGDCVGKYLAVLIQWPKTSNVHQAILLSSAILRIVFIPLIMYCNVYPGSRTTEIVFESNAYYFVFLLLLAVSNGYVGNIALMFGPKAVESKYQEITAAFLVAAIVLGCALGSILSTPVLRLL